MYKVVFCIQRMTKYIRNIGMILFDRCDPGYFASTCRPRRRIDETMQADFGIRYEPDSDFIDIWGGEVTSGDKGCGTLLSGETLYFSDVCTMSIDPIYIKHESENFAHSS